MASERARGKEPANLDAGAHEDQGRILSAQAARLFQNGNHLNAIHCLKGALTLAPNQAALWDALGNALDASKKRQQSLKAHQYAAFSDPLNAAFLSNYGRALIASGHWSTGAIRCKYAVALDPSRVEAYFNRAMADKLLGELTPSLDGYLRALLIQPKLAQAFCNMAEIHALMNQLELAEAHYHRALEIDPRQLMAWVNLGNLYLQFNRHTDARRAIMQAITLAPASPAALSSFGSLLKAKRDFSRATVFYQRALCVFPFFVETLSNLGNVLREQEHWKEAALAYQSALILDPAFSAAFYNWGITLYRQGHIDAVEQAYDRARCLLPDFPEVHLNLGFLRLSLGDYRNGFPLYEWRFKQPHFALKRRRYDFPEWDGEKDLRNTKLLVYAEQGLGDTLQFFRFIGSLQARGAHVTVEVQRELVEFLRGYCTGAQIVAMDQAGLDFDLHTPLMSLPLALGTSVTSIPPNFGGYRYNQSLLRRWIKRLGPRHHLRVGIVLSGNPQHVNDHLRSIPWTAVQPLLDAKIDLICLQKEIRADDLAFIQTQSQIHSLQGEIQSFEDTAVLCSQMDLVLSVDTSVAHLAASLGIPTWILLTEMPDWRWMLGTEDSPWYPSVRLLRKKNGTSWRDLLESVAQQLAHL